MKPETAFVVRRVLEGFFNRICKTYNISQDPESYRQLLQSFARETFPGRDQEFYSDIYLDFLVNIVEPAQLLGQGFQGGESPHGNEINEEIGEELKAEAPWVAELINQGGAQKGGVPHLQVIQVAVDQIEALGDCLVAIGAAKGFEIRKKTLVSLGILIRKVTENIEDLLNNHRVKEINEK